MYFLRHECRSDACLLFAAMLKNTGAVGTKSMSPGPQQHRLPMVFQQAFPAALLDLKLAIKCQCDYYSGFFRYAITCHGLGGGFVHMDSSWACPFPCAGIDSCKFCHRECRVSIAASLCKGLKLLCLVMAFYMEETLVISACFFSNIS